MTQENNIIHLNNSVGIIGTKQVSVSDRNGEKTITIKLTGTARNTVIPRMDVFCEDFLAKVILERIAAEEHIPLNIHITGSWKNLPRLNFGLTLLKNLNPSLKEHVFLCIVDGDIQYSELEASINNAFDGNYKPDYLPKVITDMESSITSFKIESKDNISGTPEYNHKMWLEKITEDLLLSSEPHKSIFDKCAKILSFEKITKEVNSCVMMEINHEKRVISEILRFINTSRSIEPIKSKSGRTLNYHNYYNELSEKIKVVNSFMHLPVHYTHDTVIKLISTYQPEIWLDYTNMVRIKLKEKWKLHQSLSQAPTY
ncbi:hypothetical protein ACSMDK_25120 [Yersinia enterocolitica]|uniref:hypothetical protein n=1 Tax=Yersinia TaxID=629 RepID=UPI003AB65057